MFIRQFCYGVQRLEFYESRMRNLVINYVISFLRIKATILAFVAKRLSDISKIFKLIAELPSARQVILTH